MNPLHAHKLLKYMIDDLSLDLEYPVICNLLTGGESIPASTSWYTDDSGACLVKATVDQGQGSTTLDLARRVTLCHQDISLDYWIQNNSANYGQTKLAGIVQGSFGKEAEPVSSTRFLIPNLPDYLSSNRDIKKFVEIDGELAGQEHRSDSSAMVLRYEPWVISLNQIDQNDSLQCDYIGSIQSGDRELKKFEEHLEVLNIVSLFLTWICGSIRHPSYAVGYQNRHRICGFVDGFQTPSTPNNRWFNSDGRRISVAANSFSYFSDLLQTPEVSLYIAHAINDYAESYNASSVTSKLANTHSALTAICRWDREDSSKSFSFYRDITGTISSCELDGAIWNPVAKKLDEYRNNILHVQPKWAYHDDPSAFRVWLEGQELVEVLLARKFGLKVA